MNTNCTHLEQVLKYWLFFTSAGAEEDSPGQDGSLAEPRVRPACRQLHPQVPGEAGYRHLPHQILCDRGQQQKLY